MMSTFPWTAAWLVLLLTATPTLAAETEEQQAEEQQQHLRREQEVTIEDPFWFQTELPEDYDYILPVGTANEILGGTRVSAGVYPYFVSLEYNGQIYCGATLISPNRVLSAAHCFFTRSGAIFLPTNIRVGHVSTTDGETVAPSCVKIHPQYGQDRQGLYSDVAVLKLATPVTTVTEFSQLNSFVGYPTDQAQGLTAIGFGLTSNGGTTSSHLLQTSEAHDTIANCKANWKCADQKYHVCANGVNSGTNGVCNGDSGGPLYDAAKKQVGVTSFGSSVGCGSQYSDVFANVASYYDWIQGEIASNQCSSAHTMFSGTPCSGVAGFCAVGQMYSRVRNYLFDFWA